MAPPTVNTPDTTKRGSTVVPKNRSPTPSSQSATPATNNLARKGTLRGSTGSPMSAKGMARKPAQSGANDSGTASEESKAGNAALVDDLKEQLRKAEQASDDYQKQLFVLQSRLDDVLSEHSKLEETSNEKLEKIRALEKDNQDAMKKNHALEQAYDSDRLAALKDKEDAFTREEELNGVIQRLKDSLSQREARKSVDGESMLQRATSFRGRSSPRAGNESPTPQTRENSQNNSKLVLQKDKVIESLRLELAEAQIRLVEMENAGGGHMQELEKMLLEARMSNAKLMEDNESYQVLLSEKTLNGEFTKHHLTGALGGPSEAPDAPRTPSATPGTSSLADELENANDENVDDRTRKLENELTAAKDQNKALTLYINKIITRLLQSETFETLFENGSLTGDNPLAAAPGQAERPKDLRKIPSSGGDGATDATTDDTKSAAQENAAPSLLQRAGSIFGGKRPRPKSLNPSTASAAIPEGLQSPSVDKQLPPVSATATHLTPPTENPETAPSLPLRRSHSNRGGNRNSMGRGHRRATSEWSANIVNNMYRGPPGSTGIPTSPTGLQSPRRVSGSFFGSSNAGPPPPLILEDAERKAVDNAGPNDRVVSRSDIASDSGYGDSKPASEVQSLVEPGSPRAAAAAALEGRTSFSRVDTLQSLEGKGPAASSSSTATSIGGGGWFSGASKPSDQGKMRPLRLVQEKVEADEAALAERKKANRGSIMGWFSKGAQGPPPASGLGQSASPPPATLPATIGRQASYGSRPSTAGTQEG